MGPGRICLRIVGGRPAHSHFSAAENRIDATLTKTYARTYGLPMATRVVPKTELRDRIREELAQLGEDSLLITERGRPLAIVVSVERWN